MVETHLEWTAVAVDADATIAAANSLYEGSFLRTLFTYEQYVPFLFNKLDYTRLIFSFEWFVCIA